MDALRRLILRFLPLPALTAVAVLFVGVTTESQANSTVANQCQTLTKVVERPNGKVVGLADDCGPSSASKVIQYLSSGRVDLGFGADGIGRSSLSGTGPSDLVLGPGGRVLLVRGSEILALEADGQVDRSFGEDGVLDTGESLPNGPTPISAITFQLDGKFLVAGITGGSTPGVPNSGTPLTSRYMSNGDVDPTFGEGGATITPLPTGVDSSAVWISAGVIKIGPDGNIYMGSNFRPADSGEAGFAPTVLQLTGNGSVVSSYGSMGFASAQMTDGAYEARTATSLDLESDGSARVLGTFHNEVPKQSGNFGVVAQFNPSGAEMASSKKVVGNAVGLTSGGGALSVGSQPFDGLVDPSFVVRRSDADGQIEQSFGTAEGDGFHALIGGGSAEANFAVQSSDKNFILASGSSYTTVCRKKAFCEKSLVLVKLSNDGHPVKSFGNSQGISVTPKTTCSLGQSRNAGGGWIARHRCRVQGGAFRIKASTHGKAGRSPEATFSVLPPKGKQSLRPAEPWDESFPFSYSFVRTPRLVFHLPGPLVFRGGSRPGAFRAQATLLSASGTDRISLSRDSISFKARRLTIRDDVLTSRERPLKKLIVRVRPGALRPPPPTNRRLKLRMSAVLTQSGSDQDSVAKSSTRVSSRSPRDRPR